MRKNCYPAAQALIDKAMKVDPALAADIRAFARSREYGLVFEHNRPEAMRLYGKPINEGDTVHVLPERGTFESEESRTEWSVLEVVDGIAHLRQAEEDATLEVPVDDIVAVAEYDQPIYAGLREVDRVERGSGTPGDPGDKPYHLVINGENYHALEALEFCYAGKVDCIYIDPPYNTGARDWKYNNDYVDGSDAYKHSKWLAWMERRLKLAKTLLNPEDSVLVCTIDEKEYLRLGLLLEQLFPEASIQMISSVINPKGVAAKNGFRRADEYIFFVMMGVSKPISTPLTNEWSASSTKASTNKAPSKAEIRLGWTSMMRRGSHSHRTERPGLYYPVFVDPESKTIVEVGEALPEGVDRASEKPPLTQVLPIRTDGSLGRWQVGPEELRARIRQGRVRLGRQTSYGFVINHLPDGEYVKVLNGDFEVVGRAPDGSIIALPSIDLDKSVAPTQWKIASHNATEYGTGYIKAFLGLRTFPYSKSLYAVEDTLRFFVANKPESLIVDFFSGSGTTAHATMRLNRQDGGRRRCISITNNEVGVDEQKAFIAQGLRQGDPEWEKYGVCEYITWPRVKAAITGLMPDGKPVKGDYGIKVDEYQEVDVVDPETGKKIHGKFFKKVEVQSKSVPDPFPMAEGFDENAVFFDLTYEDPDMVSFGMAFAEIAPLLWMRAGCRGRIIEQEADSFVVADNYAVLFEYAYLNAFAKAIEGDDAIKTVFVVTNDDHRFANAKKMFPGRDVVRLYESYLHSFQIASEGALS